MKGLYNGLKGRHEMSSIKKRIAARLKKDPQQAEYESFAQRKREHMMSEIHKQERAKGIRK